MMANKKQVEILKQGAEVWNRWRENKTSTEIELSKANLSEANLSKADLKHSNLRQANLIGTNLMRANLSKANIKYADLSRANLRETHLIEANLMGANFYRTDLTGANLRKTDLREANLSRTDLNRADLRGTDLRGADLFGANLVGVNLSQASVGGTTFGDTDLSETIGLEEVIHDYPSTVGTDTLQRSKGKISTAFLRGCGLSDLDIEYAKLYNLDLSNQAINDILYKIYDIRASQSIQISPLFISYSHTDAAFVNQLEVHLNEKGIRFWRDIHDATAGRLEKQIEQAIRYNPTVLVVLSKNSIKSDWVEHEVRKARNLEKELGRDVLCPIALDSSWKSSPWPERVTEQIMEYHILDFSKWQNEQTFEKMFAKLLDGLQVFYKNSV